ncbi:MAG: hypothetical protein ACE5GU_14330 [Candidatus Scalinduaceae bacterium]
MYRNFNIDNTSTPRLNDKVGQALSVTSSPARKTGQAGEWSRRIGFIEIAAWLVVT